MLDNIILALVLLVIIGGAVAKLIAYKKKGVHCPGCPYSQPGSAGCNCSDKN